ncbi:uncharacterized protein C8Q71DRAFT_738941 [Rhodofomes roseus]|uniref:Uncharacterized protein n=1 Tax=Rhodofomes roseus TaxID=34475 RepID=A0ABQ8KSM5_9APHY|nr:uncharacterized protein C8Q71DRAFT_738941 [Rhodofomes roseus]KAH9841821.1 hypothetical protein C8Q71DRAFT_738941 [Rhodofomes roseus]
MRIYAVIAPCSPISIAMFLQPDVCPILETFVFDCGEKLLNARSPPLPSLYSTPAFPASSTHSPTFSAPPMPSRNALEPELHTPNCTLRRISIRGMGISRLYPNRPSHAQDHLPSLLRHHTLFPTLETVHTVGFLVDACTDQFAGRSSSGGRRSSRSNTPTLRTASRRSSRRITRAWYTRATRRR